MKRILLTMLLAIAPGCASAEDTSATIKQAAEKCAKALLSADYAGVVAYTPKRVVDGMGGKEAMIDVLKSGTEKMHSQGASIEDATVGQPETPRKIGTWLVAWVPEHLIIKVNGQRLAADSHLLGISEDDGKKWVFVDVGPITKEKFAQIFPELAGKIELPAKKPPVLIEK